MVENNRAETGAGTDCRGAGRTEVAVLLADNIGSASGNTEVDSNSAGHIVEGIHMPPAERSPAPRIVDLVDSHRTRVDSTDSLVNRSLNPPRECDLVVNSGEVLF